MCRFAGCCVLACWVLVRRAWCVAAWSTAQRRRSSRRGQMPTLPLTQLDERALAADLDNRTFTLTFAQPVPIRDLLLLLVRGTNLSVVPDPAIAGIVHRRAEERHRPAGARLDPAAARPRLRRRRRRSSACSRASPRRASSTSTTSRPSATARRRVGGAGDGGSCAARVERRPGPTSSRTSRRACRRCCPSARTFNVDRKAGLLQVTDFPERLDRVSRLPRRRAGPRPPPGRRSTRASSRSS